MNVNIMIGKSREWKPWYRQRGYKGNLTEDEKRFLDSFRNGEPHPATSFGDLPDEVQTRLIELEDQLRDQEDTASLLTMLVWFLLSGYAFYSGYNDYDGNNGLTSVASYCFSVFGIIMLYKSYKAYSIRHEHHNWYGDTEKGEPFSSTDEGLQRCWEWKAVSAYRHRNIDSD